MTDDKISFEILEDGTIKVLTEGISGVNHKNADELLALVAQLAGGETRTEKRNDARRHTHTHKHSHARHSH